MDKIICDECGHTKVYYKMARNYNDQYYFDAIEMLCDSCDARLGKQELSKVEYSNKIIETFYNTIEKYVEEEKNTEHIEIKDMFGDVMIRGKYKSIKDCVEKNKNNLSQLNLCGVDLSFSNLPNANFQYSDLREINLSDSYLNGGNFSDVDLCKANLRMVELCNADLYRVRLYNADLYGAKLIESNLSNADLRCTNLRAADLRKANLHNADLGGANLIGADFRGAVYTNGEILNTIPIQVLTKEYSILITGKQLTIGCETHSKEDWFRFDDRKILRFDGKAGLLWWKKWKPKLQHMCE